MRRLPIPDAERAPAPEPDAPIAEWLSELRRLHGVPLGHLVPDEQMLPADSLRIFSLDHDWVDALCDGALSLRRAPGAEAALRHTATRDGDGDVTGFLLRSELVWRWPTLVVTALGAGNVRLHRLREDRLAPDVLLGLYAGALQAVILSQPAETLHFGIRETAPMRGKRVVDVDALQRVFANGSEQYSPADFAAELIWDVEHVRLQERR